THASRSFILLSAVAASSVPVSPFLFTHTPPTAIYTLSLHDALPISGDRQRVPHPAAAAHRHRHADVRPPPAAGGGRTSACRCLRSEEHTSELQSQSNLVCRLLLEKKKKKNTRRMNQ